MADVTFDFGVEYDFTDTFKVDVIGAKGNKGDKGDKGDTGNPGTQIVDDLSKVKSTTNVVVYTKDEDSVTLVEEEDLANLNKLGTASGTNGQLLRKTTGGAEWADVGLPTDEQTASAVTAWLDKHPEATTTVQDGSITSAKFTTDLQLHTLKDYVTPEMFGAAGDGLTDDSNYIQLAVDTGKPVYLFGKYKISSTISGIKLLHFENAEITTTSDIDMFTMSGDLCCIDGCGKIKADIDNYSHSIITVQGPASRCVIEGISIYGKAYNSPSGTGIMFDASLGRHYGHRICCTIGYFNYGIRILANNNWCNNFNIDILTEYNNISIYSDGEKESSGHYGKLRGQAPLYTDDGCIIRAYNDGETNTWDVKVFDVGNSGNINTVLDITKGYAIMSTYYARMSKRNGNWTYHLSPSTVITNGSAIEGCINKSWVTHEMINDASDFKDNDFTVWPPTNTDLLAYPLAYVGPLNEDKGVKYTFSLPKNINIGYFTFVFPSSSANPYKLILTVKSESGEGSVEILGSAINGMRTFDANELFGWKPIYQSNTIELSVIGASKNCGTYTRLQYFGVFATNGMVLD